MPFSATDVGVVESIAASAGVCLHKALLFGDLKRAQRKTGALLEMVQATASSKGTFDVVEGILESVSRALRAVRASLFLFDAPAGELQCLVSDTDLEDVRVPTRRGIAG